jgi:hypothetical protein
LGHDKLLNFDRYVTLFQQDKVRALGSTEPPDLLVIADEVIE